MFKNLQSTNDEKRRKKCSNGINLIMIKTEYVFSVSEYKTLNKKKPRYSYEQHVQ